MSESPLKQNIVIALDQLKPHPRNYQVHPEDEIEHLIESIRLHGIYRNIVIAQDGTILAGHGVVEAARKLGMQSIPVYQMDYSPDDPRALKLLAGDNEISHLAEVDDRALTELLRELNEDEIGLLGTGYDDMMLANLVMVSRPAAEIADLDAASQWVGLPEYDEGPGQLQITMHFASEADRTEFSRRLGLDAETVRKRKSMWFPDRENDDVRSVRFTDGEESDDDE